MVLPAKMFEIKGDASLQDIYDGLRGLREEEPFEGSDGQTLSLVTEVLDLELGEDRVSGVFSRDYVRTRTYRRRAVEAPTTEEAPFWAVPHGGRMFLMVVAPSVARGVKKMLTGHVANRLSEALFGRVGFIVEARIPHETLVALHESNPQATKLIWFDDVDIPAVEKLCLAGSGLADTGLYREYLQHGKIWYVVFEGQKRGVTVGITRGGVVTLFSRSSLDEFVRYITEDLLGLVE